MPWSFSIGRVLGIQVRIHVTFFLLLIWIAAMYAKLGGLPAAIFGVIFICLIFLCVLLHEFGHALAARRYGIDTPDITLLPIGGVARLRRMPDKPMQELVVAIAGPMVNVVIAAVLLAVLAATDSLGDLADATTLEDPRSNLVAKVALINIILVVFNMVPAFPMDGGRVLRALLATSMPHVKATQIAATVGQSLAILFGFLGLLAFNPILILIAVFIFIGAGQEASAGRMRDLSRNVSVREAMVTKFTSLDENASLNDAINALLSTSQHEFPVLDDQGSVVGVLTRNDMISALKQQGPDSPISAAMRTGIPTISDADSFENAFRLMQECECPALPVLDHNNQLVGLITTENVGELIMVRSVLRGDTTPSWRPPKL